MDRSANRYASQVSPDTVTFVPRVTFNAQTPKTMKKTMFTALCGLTLLWSCKDDPTQSELHYLYVHCSAYTSTR